MSVSSTAIGNQLESKIYDLFRAEILANRFFAKPECCRIFRKKGYYSKDRKKNIVFDISIELFLPGSSSHSLLVLIECKNYNHAVPVDDAEEFFAKLQQISGANIKGVIASTGPFQDGTFNYSKSKGLGLLRYFDDSQFKWILHRSPSTFGQSAPHTDWMEVYQGLTSSSYQSRYFDFYCANGESYTNSLRVFFLDLARSCIQDKATISRIKNEQTIQQRTVEFVSHTEIEQRAEAVLQKIGYSSGPVALRDICDWQNRDVGLIVRSEMAPSIGTANNRSFDHSQLSNSDHSGNSVPAGTLGRIRFQPLEITLYAQPERNVGRENFTLAHELGHHFLGHSRYMNGEYCDASDFETNEGTEKWLEDIRRMEWQANDFAACLLLPRDALVADFLSLAQMHGLKDHGFGILFLDNQPCNKANYYLVMNPLRSMYKVSRTALNIRLQGLGLLNDARGKDALARLKLTPR